MHEIAAAGDSFLNSLNMSQKSVTKKSNQMFEALLGRYLGTGVMKGHNDVSTFFDLDLEDDILEKKSTEEKEVFNNELCYETGMFFLTRDVQETQQINNCSEVCIKNSNQQEKDISEDESKNPKNEKNSSSNSDHFETDNSDLAEQCPKNTQNNEEIKNESAKASAKYSAKEHLEGESSCEDALGETSEELTEDIEESKSQHISDSFIALEQNVEEGSEKLDLSEDIFKSDDNKDIDVDRLVQQLSSQRIDNQNVEQGISRTPNYDKKGVLSSALRESSSVGEQKNSSDSGSFNQGSGFGYAQSGQIKSPENFKKSGSQAGLSANSFEELLEKASLLKTSNGKQVLSLKMTPERYGTLEMELTSKDGTLSAKISAYSDEAKAELQKLLPDISEQLLQQGVNISEIIVDVSSKESDGRNRQGLSHEQDAYTESDADQDNVKEVATEDVLLNLRRAALNIKAVDLTV